MPTLESKVREWLGKQGYPLEMHVARALQKAGFGVVQSEYFPDPETGVWREADVLAYEEHRSETCRAIFALVVECKGGTSKPWVLFTSHDNYPTALSVSRRATSDRGASILNALALKDEIKGSPLFAVPERPAYGVVVALRDGNDPSYSALQSVSKAALGIVDRLSKVQGENIIPFAWPVLIVEAPLFESFLDEHGELQLQEIDESLLIWKNPVIRRHTLVQVYRKNRFDERVVELRGHISNFLEAAGAENDRAPREVDDD